MKKQTVIIIVVSFVVVLGVVVGLFYFLKKKDKLPEFISSKIVGDNLPFNQNINNIIDDSTERKERIKRAQIEINELLPVGSTKLDVDGVWGEDTQKAYDLVSNENIKAKKVLEGNYILEEEKRRKPL